MIQNKTGQWWSPSDGWTSKTGAKVYGVTDRQSMGAEDLPEGGKWVPTDKTMKEAEEIQDIKRRAGITEEGEIPMGFIERNLHNNLKQAEAILVKEAMKNNPAIVKAHGLVHGAMRMAKQLFGKSRW